MFTLGTRLAATLLVSGGIVGGGIYFYTKHSPENLSSTFKWDGFTVLNSDSDFRAIFFDQKKILLESKKIEGITENTTAEEAGEKIKRWCEQKSYLIDDEKIVELQTEEGELTSYYSAFCTAAGITSTKGFLTRTMESHSWIQDITEEQDKDDAYNTVYTIYQNDERFLSWITENARYGETNHTLLKNKCEENLIISHRLNTKDAGENTHWWCRPLPYKTVQEKLTQEGWKKRTNWDGVRDTWKHTPYVFNAIMLHNLQLYPDDNSFSKWCDDKLSKKIIEKDIYPDIYAQVKKICSDS